jgi:hypothetical protein
VSVLVYFDTNIFDNLVKKQNGITGDDSLWIRAAASSRKLSVLVSHLNIRESMAALASAPHVARAQLCLISELADWDRCVREHSVILEKDIRHFAFNGERANSPFDSAQNAGNVRRGVERLIDGTWGLREMEPILRENSDQKRESLEMVRKSRSETKAEMEQLRKRGEIPAFEQWYEECSRDYLIAFIDGYGVTEQCNRRGLERLLRIPSLQAIIGLGMSYMYGIAVEGVTPERSDSSDMQHVVCAAAAADIFVTHDIQLIDFLRRVPIKGFRVMRWRELVSEIG